MALTKEETAEICEKFATGKYTKAGLAKEYGVSPRTIGRKISSGVTNPKPVKPKENPVDGDIWKLFTKSKMGKQKIADRVKESLDYVNNVIKRFRGQKVTTDKITQPKETITEIPMYIITSQSITVSYNGSDAVIGVDDKKYRKVRELITNENWDALLATIDFTTAIKKSFEKYGNRVEVDNHTMELKLDGVVLSGALIHRIVEDISKGNDVTKYITFLERVYDNPSIEDVNDIYRFISKHSLTINDDGLIIAYKSVCRNSNGNLVDTYTKSISNEVGETVKMDRDSVDHNSYATCSRGLHVCSKSYVSKYGNSARQKVVLKVLVDPYNICSVPGDYGGAKCRCCEYTVLSIIP